MQPEQKKGKRGKIITSGSALSAGREELRPRGGGVPQTARLPSSPKTHEVKVTTTSPDVTTPGDRDLGLKKGSIKSTALACRWK